MHIGVGFAQLLVLRLLLHDGRRRGITVRLFHARTRRLCMPIYRNLAFLEVLQNLRDANIDPNRILHRGYLRSSLVHVCLPLEFEVRHPGPCATDFHRDSA